MTNPGGDDLDENLHKWFKEKWVRFEPDGKIRGACARGSEGEGKPKCLPQKKAQAQPQAKPQPQKQKMESMSANEFLDNIFLTLLLILEPIFPRIEAFISPRGKLKAKRIFNLST